MKNSSNCIYCGSEKHSKWISFDDIFSEKHNLNHCLDCGIYFLKPQPTKEELDRAYDDSYYGSGEKKFNGSVEKVIDWFRATNARKFAKRLSPKSKVLDIGCGNGNFLHALGMQGDFELFGIELPGKSAERAKEYKDLTLFIGAFDKSVFENIQFDAIILTHVFEHLQDPSRVLKSIKELSNIGSFLQIEIPNISSWQAKLFKGDWLHLDPPRHLHFTPPSMLKKELSQLGFELISERYFSPQFSPFGYQQSILNKIFKKREVLYESLKGNKEYAKNYSALNLLGQKLFHWFSFPFFVITDFVASIFKRGATVKLIFRKVA